MRKIISKSTAVKAVVLILALIGILLIWPFRVFTGVLETSAGGTIVGELNPIIFEHENIMQEFVTQYDRLSSVDVYVTSVENGRYIACILYDENGVNQLKVFVDTQDYQIPGYVNIPMEVNVEVGKNYTLKFISCRSKYQLAVEDVPEDSAYVGTLTDEYVPVEGRHIAARYNYRLPISRQKSLLMIGIIAAIAAAICILSDLYFRKNPDKNDLVTVWKTIKHSANPLAVLVFGTLMIMVFPLKIFDSRPIDIIFYELGLMITAAIVFYAINHKAVKHQVGISFWQSLKHEDRLQYILIMFSMAMALWYACQYMNDLYDIYHNISERHMAIWLLIAMLLTFSLKEAFNFYNLIWVVAGSIYGVRYYGLNKLPETEKEYDLHNLVLKCGIIIVILAGLLLLNFIRILVLSIRDRRFHTHHGEKKCILPTAFGIVLLLFFALLIITRNTRLWGIYLVITFVCFYIRIAVWGKNKDYYKILAGGLMMNFAISLLFSWAHRYFAGYTSGRFAFIFHTVTVTAEYLTFMGAVATVLLVAKIVALPKGTNLKGVFISAWKEMTLFGFIMSYAIFTVSRTAYLATVVSTLLVILVVISCHKKQFFRIVGVFLISLMVCFPAAFTLQRMFPAMAADPVFYPIDDTDEFVRGGADWDSTNFMCVERFANLFANKILGADLGEYDFPIDADNYFDGGKGPAKYNVYGHRLDENGVDLDELDEEDTVGSDQGMINVIPLEGLLAANGFTRAEYMMLMDEMMAYVDTSNALDVLSNGRITIFRSYFNNLNLLGHDEMGAELPNGEIAIHAHNTYIQVAYDNGIVTGLAFVITMIMALVYGINYYRRNRQTEPLSLITSAVVIGFMVAGISEWVFQYCNPMTVALFLALAPVTFKVKEK